ncbi:hypothetical protein BD626DRAFT_575290 [Schizophyllum amplum]|uniref:Uncharacterized protein n=1 Tax=Schizophyllum amplum TaxID=97359 RepID=A0A550BW60_9AGAR|nr:hypothetical protein BD626DRAFT_575290 [Auriculariopsis ampla]
MGVRYAGEYKLDPITMQISGCPARAPEVRALLETIQDANQLKGATAMRANAMSFKDLEVMMKGTEVQLSDSDWTSALQDGTVHDGEAAYSTMVRLMIRAFGSSSFTLWTRCYELCRVRYKDIEFGLHTAAPDYIPYFKVRLTSKKGMQNDTFHIYQQKDAWALDMHTHLLSWLQLLQCRLGRPLEAEDYIFPSLSTNGVVQPKTAMNDEELQDHISHFSAAAGIAERYTAHSFRSGGETAGF